MADTFTTQKVDEKNLIEQALFLIEKEDCQNATILLSPCQGHGDLSINVLKEGHSCLTTILFLIG